jgi:hypothetical protein
MMKQFAAAAFLLVTALSCTKVEEPEMVQDKLRNGKWRQTAGTVRFQGRGIDSTSNYFADSVLPVCIMDDYLVFKENFSGLVNDADFSCGTGDPQEMPFTWEVKEAGNKLNIFNARRYFQTHSVYGELIEISESKFTLRYVVREQTTPGVIDTLTYENSYEKF